MKENKDKIVKIYTDGACSGNPGPGGWGALLLYNAHRKELNGGEKDTTNNRMEIKAAIEGLRALKKPSEVIIYTDSNYVKQGITKWIFGWKKKDWKGANKKPIKNVDLWQELDKEVKRHTITWEWVKGHSGDWGNERADELARNGIPKY